MLSGFADEHVKFAIVTGLRRRGMDVVTAQERGLTQVDDATLLQTATSEHRLMLTNDEDFPALHHAWLTTRRIHAGIIYWHQDKYRIGEAIHRILDYASTTSAQDAANALKFL